MKKAISAVLKISIALTLVTASSLNAVSASAPRITKERVKSMLGDEKLVIVDVRVGKDWNSSKYKIKGAVQADPKKVESWAISYGKDRTFVVY